MFDELYVAEELLEGYFSWWEYFVGRLNDLPKGGNVLLQDTFERLLLMLVNTALVVGVDLLPPELLEPQLLLDLVLEDSELWGESERRKERLLLFEDDWFGRSFDRLRGLLDPVCAVKRMLGVRFLTGVVLFALPNFQRHIKLLRRLHQLPLL